MVQISEDALRKLIVEAVEETLNARCPLPEQTREEVNNFFGKIKDIGDGNISIGIERSIRAISWIAKVRDFGSIVGGKVAIIIVLGVFTTASTIFGIGFWVWVSEIFKK
jgi:hypothetical protein